MDFIRQMVALVLGLWPEETSDNADTGCHMDPLGGCRD
jgi:hypothetical protein